MSASTTTHPAFPHDPHSVYCLCGRMDGRVRETVSFPLYSPTHCPSLRSSSAKTPLPRPKSSRIFVWPLRRTLLLHSEGGSPHPGPATDRQQGVLLCMLFSWMALGPHAREEGRRARFPHSASCSMPCSVVQCPAVCHNHKSIRGPYSNNNGASSKLQIQKSVFRVFWVPGA